MQFPGGCKTLGGSLGLALVVCAQQIAAVVPEKIGRHPRRTLDRGWEGIFLRGKNHLFAPGDFLLQVQQLHQMAVVVQQQSVGNFGEVPAGPGNGAKVQQILIIVGKCLQDHRSTSQS